MASVIDTNLLLYAANEDAPEHAKARLFLEESAASAETWFLTQGIAYEFLRVATHPKVFSRPLEGGEALGFLETLFASGNFAWLEPTEHHLSTLRTVLGELTHPAGNLFFDIRTAVIMREHGVRDIYSTDTDFLQFKSLRAINPLR